MKTPKHQGTIAPLRVAAIFIFAAGSVFGQTNVPKYKEYEEPPTLQAADILKPEYAAGPNHRVLDEVTTSDGRNTYTMKTKWGNFIAESDAILLARIAEANAMAAIERQMRTEEYQGALKTASSNPRYAERLRAMERASAWRDADAGVLEPIAEGNESTKGRDQAVAQEKSPLLSAPGSQLARMIRLFAIHFGTDPYSTNKRYEQLLENFSWIAVNSQETFALSPGPVGNETGLALKAKSLTQNFQETLRDVMPKDLTEINRRALLRMKVSAQDAEAFLQSSVFSPTKQTAVVRALDALSAPKKEEGVKNREALVKLATKYAVIEDDAEFYAGTAQLLATIHTGRSRLAKLATLEGLPVAVATDGHLVIALPWDTAYWSYFAERFIERASTAKLGQSGPIEMIITGNATPRFKAELEKRKITLVTKVFGGPQK